MVAGCNSPLRSNKPCRLAGFVICLLASISRILYHASGGVIYLGLQLLVCSCGTPNTIVSGTALHSGKDFAVSTIMFP